MGKRRGLACFIQACTPRSFIMHTALAKRKKCTGGGLVEEEDGGVRQQLRGDVQPLPLPAGEPCKQGGKRVGLMLG